MAREPPRNPSDLDRTELPIERGFPVEEVNEIAAKESRAKPHHRPIYTMHKWWARRLGSVFRTVCLYALVDDEADVQVLEPGRDGSPSDIGGGRDAPAELAEDASTTDSDSLWSLYTKDVTVRDKRILDPFMGGGTSLVEASRFGASVVGNDLNPVAWFVTKKQLEAGDTDVAELEAGYEKVREAVADELEAYYRTNCPNGDHEADAMYYFWVKEIECVSCGHDVSLFKDYRVGNGRYGDDGYNVICPDCEAIFLADDWRGESSCPSGHAFVPEQGNVTRGGNYACPDCGQKYPITDAIQEQGGFTSRLYGVEYYCEECDGAGVARGDVKGYKKASEFDRERFREAETELENAADLREYIPQEAIPEGAKTTASSVDGSDLFEHGYEEWKDMFNSRQLLCLSLLLRAIDEVRPETVREYLLLAFSDSLMFQNTFSIYNLQRHTVEGIFKSNSFDPQMDFVENNVWGTEYGRGTFRKTWRKLLRGVEYASAPTDRFVADGSSEETPPFHHSTGGDWEITVGDSRELDYSDEFDAVITDPPYYDNVIYSELSDFFYAWQRVVLGDEYDHFEPERTPRGESIVANPAENKGVSEFEDELERAFATIEEALVDDGVLTFTYHHSDAESWGELLESLCNAGFEVTATYPVNADINKLTQGETVSFDIIVVARPTEERDPISWNSLRRSVLRTARQTHRRLEQRTELSAGDIGVIEMGRCFHEYSKHHGEVRRGGDVMSAKEVVDEIYGIIQYGSDVGAIDVFLDLLETENPTYDDLNKLTRGTKASLEEMKDARLYRRDEGEFVLGTWDDEKRQAYVRNRVSGDGDGGLTVLDKAHLLRYRYERGRSVESYLERWDGGDDDLRDLCEGLADATDDEVYRRVLGGSRNLGEY